MESSLSIKYQFVIIIILFAFTVFILRDTTTIDSKNTEKLMEVEDIQQFLQDFDEPTSSVEDNDSDFYRAVTKKTKHKFSWKLFILGISIFVVSFLTVRAYISYHQNNDNDNSKNVNNDAILQHEIVSILVKIFLQ